MKFRTVSGCRRREPLENRTVVGRALEIPITRRARWCAVAMTKHELLAYLDETDSADAHQVAAALGIAYATAAMALLRIVRQGLADRCLDDGTPAYWYRLSARGHERLAYYERDDS